MGNHYQPNSNIPLDGPAVRQAPANSVLSVQHLEKTYGNRGKKGRGATTRALADVSFDVNEGEFVAIMGASGSGKSTLARVLVGVWPTLAGTVRLDGADIHQWNRDQLGPHLGYLPQDIELFSGSIAENIARFREADPQQVVEAARQAGVHEMILRLPQGYDTVLGDEGSGLSGGQKQRVALARALAVEPQILLLDEPFGALDAQVRKELRRWLRQLHEELKFTSVFVTHDQEEATEVADRVVVMSQGNIEQADAPNQVWREPATRFVLEFMGEVNRLQGTIRGGQFHVGAHRWPLGYTPAYQGPVDLFLRPWEVDISRRTSLDSPLPVQVLEASPKGHYTQLVVQPLGWYNEPLTVVMHGDDAPQRGERLFVGLQHARLYNGDERIETRDEELALAQSA